MTQYKELSRREEKTVRTIIEFIFPDGEKREVEISHFMTKSENEITLGIKNRMVSEWRDKGNSEDSVDKLKTELGI